jgi:hypothetical protein
MIELSVPGRGLIELEHLVCDVNGTLAIDGQLLEGVARALTDLRDRLELHLLTADTHGRQELIANRYKPCASWPGSQQRAKYVRRLGAERVIAIGRCKRPPCCALPGHHVISKEDQPGLAGCRPGAPTSTDVEMIEIRYAWWQPRK